MANFTTDQIVTALFAAEVEHGPSHTARAMTRYLLDEIIDRETKFARSSERRATEAEVERDKLFPDDRPEEEDAA